MLFSAPLKNNSKKIMLLGSGELGKEGAIEAQRLGIEVVAVDRYKHAPAHLVANRSHVVNMQDQEADLKKLAKLSGNKKVELLHLTELEKTTGYIRGGCSPVGMKKQFPTYLDSSVEIWDEMIVSAGRRGIQMGLAPQALIRLTKAIVGTII